MIQVKEKVNYPIIATSTWWKLRKSFIQTLPTRVTENSLASMLGVTTQSVKANVLFPLKKLGFIDNEGKTTERSKRWRNDDQYPKVCEEICKEIYPQELLDTFPNPDSPRASIESWFAMETGVGESAKQKMTSFYLLLLEADPTKQNSVSSVTKAPKPNKTTSSSQKTSNSGNKKAEADKSNGESQQPIETKEKTQLPKQNTNSIEPSLHIDIQIHISSDASTQQIDQIFASMAKHLYRSGNMNGE